MFKFFINYLRLLFTTYNYPYCEKWDKELNRLMKNHTFTDCTGFSAKLGGTRVWVSNYPYTYAVPGNTHDRRPSRSTILKFEEKFKKEVTITENPLQEHIDRINQLKSQIEDIKNKLRFLPENMSTFRDEKSFMDSKKIRKHLFIHG